MAEKTIKILVIDTDMKAVIEGLEPFMPECALSGVTAVEDSDDLSETIAKHSPDVILVDFNGNLAGLASWLAWHAKDTGVVVYTKMENAREIMERAGMTSNIVIKAGNYQSEAFVLKAALMAAMDLVNA